MPRNQPSSSSTPYSGEFHLTALRTPGTVRTMIASSRRPTSRFQPCIAVMYDRTGASPYPLAICGLPPARSLGFADLGECDFVVDVRGWAAFAVPRLAELFFATFAGFLDVLLAIAFAPGIRRATDFNLRNALARAPVTA